MKLKEKVTKLRDMLLELQKTKYHYPNSDHMEYCAGCGRSPYNVPQHSDDCLVVRLARLLKETE
jgi:hypothetical protein